MLPCGIIKAQWLKWKNFFHVSRNKQYTCLWVRNKVKCQYNAIQFITILHRVLRWQWQKMNQILESQQTPHISPSQASYVVSVVRNLEKIDRVITAPCCTVHNINSSDGTWLHFETLNLEADLCTVLCYFEPWSKPLPTQLHCNTAVHITGCNRLFHSPLLQP